MTVPGVVGDIDQQGRVGGAAGELAAKRVFVADVDRQPLARHRKRLLVRRARGLVGDRNGEYVANEPTEYRFERDRLAEGHKVMLAINLSGCGADAHHAIEVALLVLEARGRLEKKEPEQQVAAIALGRPSELC